MAYCKFVTFEDQDFECKHTDAKNYIMFDKTEDKQVAYIIYYVKNKTLHIEHIERTSFARDRYPTKKYYFGTGILNNLLSYLQEERKISIKKITGQLSYFDAQNNWVNSIPFYDDFPKHIKSLLNYNLKFHLYENEDYTSEVLLSTDRKIRKNEIEEFIENHKNNKKCASFIYCVIGK